MILHILFSQYFKYPYAYNSHAFLLKATNKLKETHVFEDLN